MYPINRLVICRLNELAFSNSANIHEDNLALTPAELRLNLAKLFETPPKSQAYKRADDVLSGYVKLNMADYLADSLDMDDEMIRKAIIETNQQKKEESRLAYHSSLGPHLYVKTSGQVTQITFAAMLHHQLKIIQLGRSITELPMHRQIAIVRGVVKGHQLDHPEPLPIFGDISGYEYIPDPEHRYPFNLDGSLIGLNAGKARDNPARLKMSGKEITLSIV